MFDSVNALARRLPQPVMTGNPQNDRWLRGQVMANARLLQSEAISCTGRALLTPLRRAWRQLTRSVTASGRALHPAKA